MQEKFASLASEVLMKRGLYRNFKGILINADVNGSYNIIRKVFPKAFSDGIEGVGLHPVRLNIA